VRAVAGGGPERHWHRARLPEPATAAPPHARRSIRPLEDNQEMFVGSGALPSVMLLEILECSQPLPTTAHGSTAAADASAAQYFLDQAIGNGTAAAEARDGDACTENVAGTACRWHRGIALSAALSGEGIAPPSAAGAPAEGGGEEPRAVILRGTVLRRAADGAASGPAKDAAGGAAEAGAEAGPEAPGFRGEGFPGEVFGCVVSGYQAMAVGGREGRALVATAVGVVRAPALAADVAVCVSVAAETAEPADDAPVSGPGEAAGAGGDDEPGAAALIRAVLRAEAMASDVVASMCLVDAGLFGP